MTIYYRRTTPGTRENLGAGLAALGAAAGVAAVTFYLVRLLLAREPIASGPRDPGVEPAGDPADTHLPGREG